MLNLSDKDLDRLSREAASEHDPGDIVGPKSWDKLEIRLDRHLGHVTPHPVRGFYRLPFYCCKNRSCCSYLSALSLFSLHQESQRGQKEASSGSPPLTLCQPHPSRAKTSTSMSQNPTQTDKTAFYTQSFHLQTPNNRLPPQPRQAMTLLPVDQQHRQRPQHQQRPLHTLHPPRPPHPPPAIPPQAAPAPPAPAVSPRAALSPARALPVAILPANPRTELSLLVSAALSGTIGQSPHLAASFLRDPTTRLSLLISAVPSNVLSPRPTTPTKDPAPPRNPAPPLCPASASYRCPPSAALSRRNAPAQSLTLPCARSR